VSKGEIGNATSSFRDITMMDVANEARVSIATVSRVINNMDHVRPEMRGRVLRAMEKLGYVINMPARSLAGGTSYTVGLLVNHLSSGYVVEIMRGVDMTLQANQYDLMLYNANTRKSGEAAYAMKLTRHMIDGLLLVLPRNAHAYLDALHQRGFPHVLVDHLSDRAEVPSVATTNFRGAYEAVDYLLRLGHRRIGFITGDLKAGCAQQRLEGYKAALKDAQVKVDSSLIYEGLFFQPQGYQGAHQLLSLPEPPTAIFASNDSMAFGVIEAARERGLRLPEDLSIIGFDDVLQATYVRPQLTTVSQSLEEMGRRATTLLLHYIKYPNSEIEHVELPTKLIIRESCQAPRSLLAR
jgi:LacI family transcriptional regulator